MAALRMWRDGTWELEGEGVMDREDWMPEVDRVIEEVTPPKPSARVGYTLAQIAEAHGVAVDDMVSPCRKRELVAARVDAYRVLKALGFSYPQIARWFGRDHSSVVQTLQAHNRTGARGMRRAVS